MENWYGIASVGPTTPRSAPVNTSSSTRSGSVSRTSLSRTPVADMKDAPPNPHGVPGGNWIHQCSPIPGAFEDQVDLNLRQPTQIFRREVSGRLARHHYLKTFGCRFRQGEVVPHIHLLLVEEIAVLLLGGNTRVGRVRRQVGKTTHGLSSTLPVVALPSRAR